MARSEVVELRLSVELLEIKIDYLLARRRVGPAEAFAWGSAFSVRWRRRYKLARVCRVWRLPRASIYRHRIERRKRKSRSIWSDEEIVDRLRGLIDCAPFPAERYRKLWYRLRLQNIFISKERVRKLINENNLLPAYGSILANRPNLLWGIDAARVTTLDRIKCYVIFAIDHCTGECLAIDVVIDETPTAWSNLVDAAVAFSFGAIRPFIGAGLRIRCDNLPLFRESTFCDHLAALGIRTSYITPLNPRSNGLAERFVRILRDNRLAIRYYSTFKELYDEMAAFRITYNDHYILQRWSYRTPAQVRALFHEQ